MDKAEKYRASSLANFTPQELQQVRENVAFVARRFPEEHAASMAIIEEKGLGNHREVVGHYLRNKVPMSGAELGMLQMFSDTSYAGAFGKGEQHEAPSTKPSLFGGSAGDRLYRPAIKPDGA